MYQNITNQNPLVNRFNTYMTQNPNVTPFQNNQLMNNNVHVINNLNEYIHQHKNMQQNLDQYQNQYQNQIQESNKLDKVKQKSKTSNIIEDMLKPQKISKGESNKDVLSNFKARKEQQEEAMKGKLNIKMTNAPYKSIIKDKIINKKVEDVTVNDLLVHRTNKLIDANIDNFEKDLKTKKMEEIKINDELQIEFSIDNYDRHKKKFEYKETFIKNMAFEENTFDESKQDYVDFYRQKQKEAEEGKKLCDQILHNIIDEGIVSKDELPKESNENINIGEIDLKKIFVDIDNDKNSKSSNTKNIKI